MAHRLISNLFPFGMNKLSKDMATLVNNRQGSDVQFKVGGIILKENGETIHDESAIETVYAHSAILRCRSEYFAAMLNEENNWKESTNGLIYKPNISPRTFQDLLYYIYTGNVPFRSYENIVELIIAADEMGLEELSIECQDRLIVIVKYIFFGDNNCDEESDDDSYKDSNDDSHKDSNESDFDYNDYEYEWEGTSEVSTEPHISTDGAVWRNIIQALNIVENHSLSHLSQKLFDIILPHISVIIASPDAYAAFLNGISSETLAIIVASDNLGLTESGIWDLVLSWACHQTSLIKTLVEERLKKISDSDDDENIDEESSSEAVVGGMVIDAKMEENIQTKSDYSTISIAQLKQLKTTLAPFLPAIRFSLLEAKDYARIMHAISYFLSRRRFLELQQFFIDPEYIGQLDSPRMKLLDIAGSMIFVEPTIWKLLRENIFETGGIAGCASSKNLKFDLLFRASEHGFLATTFHQRCDNKGPTLVIVRDADGDLFGGVNFVHWKSDESLSSSSLNFLFALPDKNHRNYPAISIFRIKDQAGCSIFNGPDKGPTFGSTYLEIANAANTNQDSYSFLVYVKNEVLDISLADVVYPVFCFTVSDYEVFAISGK